VISTLRVHRAPAPGRVGLKIFLSKWTDRGPLCIARAPDGRLQLMRDGEVLATDRTLDGLMRSATEWMPEGGDARSGWYLTAEPLDGPVIR
jgi:hypothetical protein